MDPCHGITMDHVVLEIISSLHNHIVIDIPCESLWATLFAKTCTIIRNL